MNKLVFLEPNCLEEIPFTTSEVIAKYGKVKHHALQQMVLKYSEDIEEFGKLSFEMRPLEDEVNAFEMRKPNEERTDLKSDLTNTSISNRRNKGGRPEKIYHLNEQQATLLITYMKNTLPVRKFKKALVKQFYIMQKELTKRTATRMIGKQAREALTNAIQSLPDSPHKSMKYKHYTDLVYKIVFNKNSKQLREEYGITSKDSLRDYFTAGQITDIERLENQIGVLIDLGNDYQTIKIILTKKYLMTA